MATRRVLVLDDDSEFLSVLQGSLGVYDFEIQSMDPIPDSIRTLKILNPDVIFISADLPDKIGYTLCGKTRTAMGKKVFIAFTTAVLSSHDLSMHQKQRLHADLYLDKRNLSKSDLLNKLDKSIKLGPRIKPLPTESEKDIEQDAILENGSDLLNKDSTDSFEAADLSDSSMQDTMLDQLVLEASSGKTDLDRRLAENRTEIFNLRCQLGDALRDARSSPFSTDFLKLREIIKQKDLEITLLTEELNNSKHKIRTSGNRIKELEKHIHDVEAEKTRILKREEELTTLTDDQQQKIAELQELQSAAEKKWSEESSRSTEMLTLERQAHQQTRQEFESKIAQMEEQHAKPLSRPNRRNRQRSKRLKIRPM